MQQIIILPVLLIYHQQVIGEGIKFRNGKLRKKIAILFEEIKKITGIPAAGLSLAVRL